MGRKSQLFRERKLTKGKYSSIEDGKVLQPIKITNFYDLLALFKVQLNDNMTFNLKGAEYQLDFANEQVDNPEHQISAFFAGPSKSHMLENSAKSSHTKKFRTTFGNMIEDMDQATLKIPLFNNFTADVQQRKGGGLVDIDRMVLSNEPSPTSMANKFTTSMYMPNFSRIPSKIERNQVDEEVQVNEIDFEDSNDDIERSKSISGIPHLQYTQSIQLQAPHNTLNHQLPNPFLDEVIDKNDPDYLKKMQAKLALEIELEQQRAKNLDIDILNKPNGKMKSENPHQHHAVSFQNHSAKDLLKIQTQSTSQHIDLVRKDFIPQVPSLRRIASMGDQRVKNDIQVKLNQVTSENQQLMEKIVQLENQVSKKYGNSSSAFSQSKLTLAFVYSTPLVIKKDSDKENFRDRFKIQPLLEFKKELKEINESLSETKRKILLQSIQGTNSNLSKILSQNPPALHFTGHGLQKKSLLLESEDGEGTELNEDQLRDLIHKSNANLEFVFVASCHSEFAGKVFHSAGARHVICVKQANSIADEAVIKFSQSFYYHVFSQNMTVCQSFQKAKLEVELNYGAGEASKFSILTHKETFTQPGASLPPQPVKPKKPRLKNMPVIDDDELEFQVSLPEPVHRCKVFGPFDEGQVQVIEKKPKFQEVPSIVENFIGRQIETFEVVHKILKNRLVNIIGLPGIGKTALAKNAVNYINDRKLFKHGIIFFSLKGYKTTNVFIKKLVTNIINSNFVIDAAQQNQIYQDTEKLMRMIVEYFRKIDESLLVVFDSAEELLYHDIKNFREMITELINSCPQVSVLMTSRMTLGVLQDIQEKLILLQELSPVASVDLFFSRAREIKDEEKLELIRYKPEDMILVNDSKASNYNIQTTNLANHHLFKILSGNPHAIILAAPLLMNQTLTELYKLLNSPNLMEVLKVDGVTDSTVASLCLSLQASISVLEKDDQISLTLFFLIGLLPGGIFIEELEHIWRKSKQISCEAHVQKLMDLSLLQKKEQAGDKNEQKLMLPPFINNFAEQTIDLTLKNEYQQQLCKYYAKILREIYRQDYNSWYLNKYHKENGSPSSINIPRNTQLEQEFIKEMKLKMIRHETNIWACIYRIVKSDKPIQIEDLELEIINTVRPKIKNRRHSQMTPRANLAKSLTTTVKTRQRKRSTGDAENEDFGTKSAERTQEKTSTAQELREIKEKTLRESIPASQVIHEEASNMSKSDVSGSQHLLFRPRKLNLVIETQQNPQEFNEEGCFDNFDGFSKLIDQDQEQTEKTEKSSKSSYLEGEESLDEITYSQDYQGISIAINPPSLNTYMAPVKQIEPEVLKIESPKESKLMSTLQGVNRLIDPIKQLFRKKISNEITNVMRNSIVSFKRPSIILKASTLTSIIEDRGHGSDDDKYVPQKSFSQADMMPKYGLAQTYSSPDTVNRGLMTLSDSEKLIIYYGMNLYLLRDDESAINIKNKYSNGIKGASDLFDANICKILGLIYLRKGDIQQAYSSFVEAECIFDRCKSNYGKAISRFALGSIYQNNFTELIQTEAGKKYSMSDPNDLAISEFIKAKVLFESLSHYKGLAVCYEHLHVLYKEEEKESKAQESLKLAQENQLEYQKYHMKYKKSCVHVERIDGDDISLIAEIVIHNGNENLFPDLGSSVMSNNSSRQPMITKKDLFAKSVSSFNDLSSLKYQKQSSDPTLNHQTSAPQALSTFKLQLQGLSNSPQDFSPQLPVFERNQSAQTSNFSQTDKGYFGESDEIKTNKSDSKLVQASNRLSPTKMMYNQKSVGPLGKTFSAPLQKQNLKSGTLEVVDEEDDLPNQVEGENHAVRKQNSFVSCLMPMIGGSKTSRSHHSPQLQKSESHNPSNRSPLLLKQSSLSLNSARETTQDNIFSKSLELIPDPANEPSPGMKSPMRLVEQSIELGKAIISKFKQNIGRKNSIEDSRL